MIIEGSRIHTLLHGQVSVDTLRVGTIVQTHRARTQKVKNKFKSQYSGTVIMIEHLGGRVTVTPDHKIGYPHPEAHRRYKKNGNPEVLWHLASQIEAGDTVWAYDGEQYLLALVTHVNVSLHTGEVYGAKLDLDKAFIADGIVIQS